MLASFPFPHELAVTAILKNEGDYVKEWLDYHLAAGVTMFYLYDNESDDDTREILRPYIERGLVEYNFFPGNGMQVPAYNDAIYRHKFDCRYMAVIDLDEFIRPCADEDIPATVRGLFASNPNAGGIAVNWRVFGSAGEEKKDLSRGVLERFTQRGRDDFAPNVQIKSIVNPRCVELFVNPHYAFYFVGRGAVSEAGQPVKTFENPQLSGEKIVIHHYFTKSKEEYMEKIRRGNAYQFYRKRPETHFFVHDVNDVFDDSILRYRDKMRAHTPSPVRSRNVKFIVENITGACQNATSEELVNRIDDLLAYRHFCRVELPKYIGSRRESEHFVKIVNRALELAFCGRQDAWQCQLFLSVAPELLTAESKSVAALIRKVIAPVQEIYRQGTHWERYEKTEMLRRFCELYTD